MLGRESQEPCQRWSAVLVSFFARPQPENDRVLVKADGGEASARELEQPVGGARKKKRPQLGPSVWRCGAALGKRQRMDNPRRRGRSQFNAATRGRTAGGTLNPRHLFCRHTQAEGISGASVTKPTPPSDHTPLGRRCAFCCLGSC
jgi:hypothetical protein